LGPIAGYLAMHAEIPLKVTPLVKETPTGRA
jgi:hypothetical protein